MPTWFRPGAEQLGEDAGLRAGVREVREEARALPVRDPRQEHLVEVAEHVRERLGALRRRGRQPRAQLARLDLREHGQLAHALEVATRPSRPRRRRPRGSSLAAASRSRPTGACSAPAPSSARPGAPGRRRARRSGAPSPSARRSRSRASAPASPASRACASRRSSRSGCELISRNVPVASAASTTFSTSTSEGLRTLMRAAREVADAVDVRVLHRVQHPLGRVLVEARVHRGHHPVELREHLVGDVELAVGADVHLDPLQDPERRQPLVERVDLLPLRSSRPSRRHVRVVADREVLVPERLRGARPSPRSSPCRPTRSCASAGRRAGRRARRAPAARRRGPPSSSPQFSRSSGGMYS